VRDPGIGARRGDGCYDVTDVVVGLVRTLRAAGIDVPHGASTRMLEALDRLDPSRRADVYWAGRLTLCAGPDDVARYDRVFAAYFGDRPATIVRRPVVPQVRLRAVTTDDAGAADDPPDTGEDATPLTAAASRTEVLRHRDVAGLDQAERTELNRLLAAFRLAGELRRSRRRCPAPRGRLDRSRTTRALLRTGGEPTRLLRQAPRARPRRVVLLVDVSGSMSSYADALLRFAHAAEHAGPRRVEVFTIGTRLTRVTRELGHRDPDVALRAVGDAVPDWSGGTRLGELVKEFLDVWGQRGMARGAVVVVLSDGWERGDAALLGEQMARLHRLAHRVVWCNPLKARPAYEPLVAGMAAALPHVDDFVAGHSLAALERLAAVVAGASRAEVAHA
jgi:uncharacterized protein with von Willebrand factor type A (vWA) domain